MQNKVQALTLAALAAAALAQGKVKITRYVTGSRALLEHDVIEAVDQAKAQRALRAYERRFEATLRGDHA